MQYVAVHVSVISNPHAGLPAELNVDVAVPLIKHSPDPSFVYAKLLVIAAPHATVISGCETNAGAAAGNT